MAPRYEHPFLPSTQAEAIRLARTGAEEGTVVVALRQDDGRGRLSHAWASPEGGLYLSMLVRVPTFEPGLLPVAVGTRLAGALRERFGVAGVVKWPNDLLVPGPGGPPRKLAGILVDRLASPTLGPCLVVGVGVNVASPAAAFPPELRDRVALLSALAPERPRLPEVEAIVVGAIRSSVASLGSAEGHARLVAECRGALYGVGRPALLDGTPAGVVRELGEDGALWLDRGRERVAVRAGDLTIVEAT